jgi:hypothetical protein
MREGYQIINRRIYMDGQRNLINVSGIMVKN